MSLRRWLTPAWVARIEKQRRELEDAFGLAAQTCRLRFTEAAQLQSFFRLES